MRLEKLFVPLFFVGLNLVAAMQRGKLLGPGAAQAALREIASRHWKLAGYGGFLAD